MNIIVPKLRGAMSSMQFHLPAHVRGMVVVRMPMIRANKTAGMMARVVAMRIEKKRIRVVSQAAMMMSGVRQVEMANTPELLIIIQKLTGGGRRIGRDVVSVVVYPIRCILFEHGDAAAERRCSSRCGIAQEQGQTRHYRRRSRRSRCEDELPRGHSRSQSPSPRRREDSRSSRSRSMGRAAREQSEESRRSCDRSPVRAARDERRRRDCDYDHDERQSSRSERSGNDLKRVQHIDRGAERVLSGIHAASAIQQSQSGIA
jgi:hypothetical protein